MLVPYSLLLLLLTFAPLPSSAAKPPHIIKRLHDTAIRHSAGLARDIRVAFHPILVPRSVNSSSSDAVYCVASKAGNSTLSNNGPASSNKGSGSGTSGGPAPSQAGSGSSPWNLIESHSGNNFFNGWDFFTGSDPTHGVVQFVDQNTGQNNGLVEVNGQGHAVMRVETTPQVTANRQSIRITTQSSFNGGLVIMDSVHMPTGCGTWPAFWTNGPNWPAGGEIDIVEGVNNYTNNQATIHTNAGCSLPSGNSSSLGITGSVVGGTNCAALQTGNQGCGVRAATNNTFGTGFNNINGGVYAMRWDESGIAIFFFPRGSVPSDIEAGAPKTSGWGEPMGFWPASTCNPYTFFSNHSVIFDTTLCGDWAGSVWNDTGIPGQDQSCQQRTGFSSCEAFVQANGASFAEAYWEVKSVQIYQLKNGATTW